MLKLPVVLAIRAESPKPVLPAPDVRLMSTLLPPAVLPLLSLGVGSGGCVHQPGLTPINSNPKAPTMPSMCNRFIKSPRCRRSRVGVFFEGLMTIMSGENW